MIKNLSEIKTPTLLVDENKCRKNIQKMVEKSHRLALELRPHFKTHQSRAIGEWFKDNGVHKIAVSSLGMAEYFAHVGWDDILVALPVNVLEAEIIKRLSARVNLTIVVDNPNSLTKLTPYINREINVMIEIDTGQNRSGVHWENAFLVQKIIDFTEGNGLFNFAGFMSHGGQTYQARGHEDIEKVHQTNLARLKSITSLYTDQFPEMIVSYGDTPSSSVSSHFDGVTELRPGNFVFYDLMQAQIGSCSIKDIAVSMVCPIIGTYPEQSKAIIYGGAIHFSKDSIHENGDQIFGKVVIIDDNGWHIPDVNIPIVRLSQEHGTIQIPEGYESHFEIGKLLGILPVHSCLTANMMKWYRGLDGAHLDHMIGNT